MTLRRQLFALSFAVLGCESIAPRTTPDASVDAGPTVDAPDVAASDIVDAQSADTPDVQVMDVVDAAVADTPDVATEDIVDAPFVDAPDVVSEDIVDATAVDTPDAATTDLVDVSVADTADRVTSDSVDASVNPFPSTGEDGPFPPPDAGTIITLEPRVWNFTNVHVRPGVTVRVAPGSAQLDIRATGDIIVEGVINLTGGAGGELVNRDTYCVGGDTGVPHGPRVAAVRATTGALLGVGGSGVEGTVGRCNGQVSALGGAFGGGNGGGLCRVVTSLSGASTGAGGGGFAGGGGGIRLDYGGEGGMGASHIADQGGLGATSARAAEGGEARLIGGPLEVYAGRPGPRCSGFTEGSAGGGSIGRTAARDLAVRSTFQAGSGGGGGGSSCFEWCGNQISGGGGGGGGGGAVRLASPTRVIVTRAGAIRTDGGRGGWGQTSGGGGSGGLIHLAAPEVAVYGAISANGGAGGTAFGPNPCNDGGNGGLGRIRLSVDPVRCEVTGTSNPPIPTGCAPSPDGGVPGQAYVGMWPN